MTDTIVRTVCPHDCPDMCSMIATVRDGRLMGVRGDPDHPFTRGFLCAKVQRYEERVHSPARLTTPLLRVGPKGSATFEMASWDEALTLIASRWKATIEDHGPEAIVGYAYGAHQGIVNRNVVRALFHALGASRFNPGTVCDSACAAGWEHTLGDAPGTDPETIVHSDLIICWGANVVTTNVHLVPLIEEARKRGAKLVVIDPFRTRTSRRADWFLQPKIGTDAALALGVIHVIVRDGLQDEAFLAEYTVGFDRLEAKVLPEYTPERVAAITGLAATDVERLAHAYAGARAPFLRLGMGMSRHRHGGMAVRAVACLPAVVGAWGKPGTGALMDTAAIWGFNYNAVRRPDLQTTPTREINHSLLGRALTEANDPPVKALFVASNNPAVTCPDQARVLAGLGRDDLFTVVHDAFLSDTARYADVVLPATSSVEVEDLYRSYGTYYTQHGPKLLEPIGEARSNLQVVQALADRMGIDDPFFKKSEREHMAALLAGATGPTAELSLDQVVGGGPIKLDVPAAPPRTHFYSDVLAAEGLPALPIWEPDPAEPRGGDRLRLLTGPGHFQHHSVFAGVDRLQRLEGEPCCVLHPDDAGQRGIVDGDAVVLENERGYVGLRAQVTADTLPGVVTVLAQRSRTQYLCGGPLNVLVSDDLTDMGAGATYQSTWVDVRPLGEEHVPQHQAAP